MDLDQIDRRLIDLLAADSRTALKALASAVGLSSPSVSERLKKLEERGITRRYTIDVDHAAIGYSLQAIVRVRPLPGSHHRVQQQIEETPEIVECDKVTGEDCFVVRLFATSMSHLDTIVERIAQHAETNTAIVKSQPIARRAVNLDPAP